MLTISGQSQLKNPVKKFTLFGFLKLKDRVKQLDLLWGKGGIMDTERNLTFRIPMDLFQWLRNEADKNDRTISAQIRWILRIAQVQKETKT